MINVERGYLTLSGRATRSRRLSFKATAVLRRPV